MKYLLPSIFSFVFLTGCMKDYDLAKNVTPQVIVNSILCPDSTIKIDLWWSKKLDGSSDFERVKNAHVILKEDGSVIYDIVSSDATLIYDYHPKEESTYNIIIDVEGHRPVSASTTLPRKASGDCRFIKTETDGKYANYNYFRIENVSVGSDVSALMLATINYIEKQKEPMNPDFYTYYSICTMAPFADHFNCSRDEYEAAVKGSTEEYWNYMRVSNSNIGRVFPLTYSVRGSSSIIYPEDYWEHPWDYDDTEFPTEIEPRKVILIAAGRDYDQYYKTLYLYNEASDGNIFTHDFYRIYSNVSNGLGIFASYSQTSFLFDFNK